MAENIPTTDTTEINELNSWGKFWAGLILIFFTALPIYFVIAYWPDKMPSIKDSDNAVWYTNQQFKISLIEKKDTVANVYNDSICKISDSINKIVLKLNDSFKLHQANKDSVKMFNETIKANQKLLSKLGKISIPDNEDIDRISLNAILLILVALMGFLGNMLHIATSLTTYIGNKTFVKSWILWYFVKPFTAAGLAIVIYFIIRAGFLSYGTSAAGVNLYGILSLAAFAGLFTDRATLKLKEIFEVIFKPEDERNDRLQENGFSVVAISPDTIPPSGETTLVLTGKNLNNPDIKITIDGVVVTAEKITDKLEIKYTPTATAITTKKAVLLITDKIGKAIYTKDILIN